MKSKSKNDIFYLIMLILTMITMIVGITFTYFGLVASEEKDSTKVQTGYLSINYIDGKKMSTYSLMPIDEPNLNTTYSVYKKKFKVSSDGTLDQTLDIYMNVTKNEFTNNALRFALYDSENQRIGTGSIPSQKGSKVLMTKDKYLKSNTTEEFTVLIWLQENGQDQNHERGNKFIGGFDITANQIKYE